VVVGSSVLDIAVEYSGMSEDLPVSPTILRVLRVFRVARILRLAKSSEGIAALLEASGKSFKQVGNVLLLMMLFTFMFACLGTELYAKMGCTEASPCLGLAPGKCSFENFLMSALTLVRVLTLAGWSLILADCMREPPACDDSAECMVDCCASFRVLSPLYFAVYIVLNNLMLLNIVVAILMSSLPTPEIDTDGKITYRPTIISQRMRRGGNENTSGADDGGTITDDSSTITNVQNRLQWVASARGEPHANAWGNANNISRHNTVRPGPDFITEVSVELDESKAPPAVAVAHQEEPIHGSLHEPGPLMTSSRPGSAVSTASTSTLDWQPRLPIFGTRLFGGGSAQVGVSQEEVHGQKPFMWQRPIEDSPTGGDDGGSSHSSRT